MTTTKLKKYRTKPLTKSKLVNGLVTFGLILIMVLLSIPKMALAQLFDEGEQQKVSGAPNASIKLPNTEYTESTVDLRVKVLGGEVKLNRTWINGRWYINPAWSNLRFVLDPLDSSVRTIDRAGTLYQRTGDADLYSNNQVYIKKTTEGWRWYDRQGNWINYDNDGRLVEYGDRNNVKVTFVLDNEGRRTAIKDHHGELVYSFTYDNNERLTQVVDREGRTVSYQWTGDRLTKVTDVLGYEWLYGYDNNGQLTQKTEPDSGVIKITYTDSVLAPQTAMNSGKDKQQSESSVVSTNAKDKDTKLARVGKITDKTGAVTVYNSQYNRTNKQYTITVDDPVGKKTVKVFDSKGKKISTTVNGTVWESYERDEKNYLLKVKDQRGLVTTIQYNQAKKPIKIIHPNGAIELYEYSNDLDKVTKFTDAQGAITTYEYDALGNLIKRVDGFEKPEQRTIDWRYDVYGQPTLGSLKGDKVDSSVQQSFDNYGNAKLIVDGKGNEYNLKYNINGLVTEITNPLNHTWKINYNSAGQILEAIDPLNHRKRYINDVMGRIIKAIDPLGNESNYSYNFNSDGWRVEQTNALNETTTYYYDVLKRFVKKVTPLGLETQYLYNNNGEITEIIDENDNNTLFEYGVRGSGLEGLITKATYPTFSESYKYNVLGLKTETNTLFDNNISTTKIHYDQFGLAVAKTDSAGRISQVEYNQFSLPLKLLENGSKETLFDWDILGNIVNITDANNNEFLFEYDKNNNLVKETKALGNIVEYNFDEANQLIFEKDARGNIIEYDYDAAGRNIKKSYRAIGENIPSQVITYIYNNADQLVEVIQTGNTNTHFIYERDALGRILQETIIYITKTNRITKSLKYTYDQDNKLTSITYPDNTVVSFDYENGQLKQALLANGEVITWSEYKWIVPTKVTLSSIEQNYTYNGLLQPLQVQASVDNNNILEREYVYDSVGNIINIKTEDGEINYQYDLLDRLTSVKPSLSLQNLGLPIESYAYDAVDNRIGSSQQLGEWNYNQNNQLIKWGEASNENTLSYTPNGNLLSQTTANNVVNYIYNEADRLSSVNSNDRKIVDYEYDSFGRRISKTVNGITTYYLYTDEGLIAELNEEGNIQVAYGWQPDSNWATKPLWIANVSRNETLVTADYNYILTDHLGTPQLAVNSVGQKTWKGSYEAFGKIKLDPDNKINLNLRFPGQYYDQETGLNYNYFRDYNPCLGRYIQSDPLGIYGGWNTYNYVQANPVNFIDYDGLQRRSWGNKFPKNSQHCQNIRNKINNLIKENDDRTLEILNNPQKLPIIDTGGKPSASVDGHIKLLEDQYRKALRKWQDAYKKECDDSDGPPTSLFQDIAPWIMVFPPSNSNNFSSPTFDPVFNDPNYGSSNSDDSCGGSSTGGILLLLLLIVGATVAG